MVVSWACHSALPLAVSNWELIDALFWNEVETVYPLASGRKLGLRRKDDQKRRPNATFCILFSVYIYEQIA
jgi:hypothetical protein